MLLGTFFSMVTDYAHELLDVISDVFDAHNPLGYDLGVDGDYEVIAAFVLGLALLWCPDYTSTADEDTQKALRVMTEHVQGALSLADKEVDPRVAEAIANDVLVAGDELLIEMNRPCECEACVAERAAEATKARMSVN